MGETPYTPPTFGASAFHCPHCGAFANQKWLDIGVIAPMGKGGGWTVDGHTDFGGLRNWRFTRCEHCGKFCVWHGEQLDFPATLTAPPHHPDMPADVAQDYDEARSVLPSSPRAAAALLRLSLQRLMPHLGAKSGNLNEDIGDLVKQGLPLQVQQALDTLRVVGNNAVHPGEIDLRDDPATALALFDLLNFVVQDRIARTKAIASLFDKLPESAKQAVSKRDSA